MSREKIREARNFLNCAVRTLYGSLPSIGNPALTTRIWVIGTAVRHLLLPQQNRLACGVIPDLHPQQLADGADGEIVGLAAGFVGVEDGAGDLLSVGGGDVLARRDFLRSVQGHIGKVIAHLAGGGQGGGQAGAQGQGGKKTAGKGRNSFFHDDLPFFFRREGERPPALFCLVNAGGTHYIASF